MCTEGDKNVLKLSKVTVVQLYEYTKKNTELYTFKTEFYGM